MSKLNIDQKNIKDLFQDSKADYLIPDYQRPYAWGEEECQTLWDDIKTFAFPDDNSEKFNSESDEYFLGPIVTFRNHDKKLEIIDGQQRLTTLMLLLRAFYDKFGNMRDENSVLTKTNIEKCIWKTDEFGRPNKGALKINSDVATDDDKEDFLNILKTGKPRQERPSQYAKNYIFFQDKIDEFLNKFPGYFSLFPTRIMNNCILLPIEAESQDTALRIFSTLNDRGKPLSDSDIFKAQFYKYYSDKGQKDVFVRRWNDLFELCDKNFHPISGIPMDEIFTRYMYFERAKLGIRSSTTEALRSFYEKDSYKLFKNESTFNALEDLADFWNSIDSQDTERFSNRVLRRLYVLNFAPNGMWAYFVSVYFMQYRDNNGMVDDEKFYKFLNKITAFIWTYALTNPGVNALRTPVFSEMINIVNNKEVTFDSFKFEEGSARAFINNFNFLNNRPITKSMLTWWAFSDKKQKLLPIDSNYEIEHIYPRNRQNNENGLTDLRNLEALGNKSLLEKRINIRASDYRFEDKKKYYIGFDAVRGHKEGTAICELRNLSVSHSDYTEEDIISRNNIIVNGFIEYLGANDLLL